MPGAVAYARSGWVEPSSALPLFAISALSLFIGASLGPSFGIVVSAGGLGSWLSQRMSVSDVEAQHEYALTGMGGGLSAVFAAPLFGSIMTTELAPSPKSRYVALFIPVFIASVIGFVIFTELSGSGLLGAYQIPGYQYESIHLLYGLLIGALAVVVLFVIELLLAVLVAKIIAFVASQEAGFLGGPVFPTLFIGGTAGIIVHLIFPWIPAPLAIAAMLAALPGATIAAPVSFIVLGAGVAAVGIEGVAPIGIAVITAHLAVWRLELFRQTRESM